MVCKEPWKAVKELSNDKINFKRGAMHQQKLQDYDYLTTLVVNVQRLPRCTQHKNVPNTAKFSNIRLL